MAVKITLGIEFKQGGINGSAVSYRLVKAGGLREGGSGRIGF